MREVYREFFDGETKTPRRLQDTRQKNKKISFMSTTSYPPTDYTAVLLAMAGLTAEFGMGSGDPCLYGRAHKRYSQL